MCRLGSGEAPAEGVRGGVGQGGLRLDPQEVFQVVRSGHRAAARAEVEGQTLDLLAERSHMPGTIYLKGNHEAFLLDFLENPGVLEEWGRMHGLRPEWIQPEKRRRVAHYDVFGPPAQALIERLNPPG